jgi:MFS transporter, ACS family, glucarate transporter
MTAIQRQSSMAENVSDSLSAALGSTKLLFASPKYKWLIVAMLFVAGAVNYIERVNITAVGGSMMVALQLEKEQFGLLSSAFLLGYALCQYPAGLLADRFGPRRVLALALFGWGACTLLVAFVENLSLLSGLSPFAALLIVRFLLGICESPMFPAAGRSISKWVGPSGRAAASAFVIAGISVGSAIAPPLVVHLTMQGGWQQALGLSSIPAFAMSAIWFIFSRDEPARRPGTQPSETREGKAPADSTSTGEARPESEASWEGGAPRSYLRNRRLWILTLSYALQGYISYIFVFWFFQYLVHERHLDMLESSWLATAPWLLAMITTPLGGIISDQCIRRFGYPWGRRLWPMLAMPLAGGLLIVGARVEQPYVAVALLTLCQGLVMSVEGAFWASLIEIEREHCGAGGGILNMGGNLGGVLSPWITPLVGDRIGWIPALDIGAAVSTIGGLLWLGVSPMARRPRRLTLADAAPVPDQSVDKHESAQ